MIDRDPTSVHHACLAIQKRVDEVDTSTIFSLNNIGNKIDNLI